MFLANHLCDRISGVVFSDWQIDETDDRAGHIKIGLENFKALNGALVAALDPELEEECRVDAAYLR